MAPNGERQRVDHMRHVDQRQIEARQLHVQEADVDSALWIISRAPSMNARSSSTMSENFLCPARNSRDRP